MKKRLALAQIKKILGHTHGGKREGAGRHITKEPTVVMRIPLSKVEAVKKLIKKNERLERKVNRKTG